jgi:hypothetical protein
MSANEMALTAKTPDGSRTRSGCIGGAHAFNHATFNEDYFNGDINAVAHSRHAGGLGFAFMAGMAAQPKGKNHKYFHLVFTTDDE